MNQGSNLGTLLIRADAGLERGTGHMMRCVALAQAWQDEGGEVVFLSRGLSSHLESRLRSEHFKYIPLIAEPASREDAEETVLQAGRLGAK